MALGHPIGATGAILIGTVLDELERTRRPGRPRSRCAPAAAWPPPSSSTRVAATASTASPTAVATLDGMATTLPWSAWPPRSPARRSPPPTTCPTGGSCSTRSRLVHAPRSPAGGVPRRGGGGGRRRRPPPRPRPALPGARPRPAHQPRRRRPHRARRRLAPTISDAGGRPGPDERARVGSARRGGDRRARHRGRAPVLAGRARLRGRAAVRPRATPSTASATRRASVRRSGSSRWTSLVRSATASTSMWSSPRTRSPIGSRPRWRRAARLLTDEYAPAFWVLADAEGNEACLCTWQGRD